MWRGKITLVCCQPKEKFFTHSILPKIIQNIKKVLGNKAPRRLTTTAFIHLRIIYHHRPPIQTHTHTHSKSEIQRISLSGRPRRYFLFVQYTVFIKNGKNRKIIYIFNGNSFSL
uniref:Uncharacterized protein n=1 Tax=Sipha flava TaxID=143950 RepID=A0A2S2R413_9HEMI